MKYISPICELEALETEDIMESSRGVEFDGNVNALTSKVEVDTVTEKDENGVEQTYQSVSVSVGFDRLFGKTSQ